MTPARYGAAESDWAHFDLVLGLGPDLLPVVSDPTATISPGSKMKGLGKTPSMFNKSRKVAGIVDWTAHVTTDTELKRWAAEPDYGICLQTRTVRALDCDITDPQLAKEISDEIDKCLGLSLPARRRAGAPKFLLAFALPGAYAKRTIKTAHGIIEFLADGQQFVAIGTHPSGTRYEWAPELPANIPALTPAQFESLWAHLESKFGIEPSTTTNASVKAGKLADAAANDPTAAALASLGLVLGTERDGRLHITCPWEEDHTPGTGGESATTYWPANTGGYQLGHFKCLHASHADKTDKDFLEAIGIAEDYRDDFTAIEVFDDTSPEGAPVTGKARFAILDEEEYSAGQFPGWIVKGLLPKGELGTVYGPPASGKSFWTFDLVECVARGVPWRGKKVTKGNVVYIAAEGAGGFKTRISAYRKHHNIPAGTRGVSVLAGVPNLMTRLDIIDLGNSIRAFGRPSLIVYDTLARGTAGADENSAKDMGIAIANCRTLYEVTGAMVLLVAHTGKDISKGMRGSNAPLGAVDVEIEIQRDGDNRTATVKKLKDGGPDGGEYGFTLKTVAIGMDEDGDVVSSCVVEHGDAAPRREREKKLGAREEAVLHTFNRMSDDLAGKVLTIKEVTEAAAEEYGGRPSNMVTSLYALEKRGLVDLSDGKNCRRGGQ